MAKIPVLATGLSGLVGSRIAELLSETYELENLDLNNGHDILKIDTLEPDIACSPAKCLIHLAAFTDVGKAWQEKDNRQGLCYQINVIGTRNITQLCKKYNKHLIHFSTDFVFSGQKDTPYTEEDKTDPLDWYGQTKALAEEEVTKNLTGNTILRIAYPFRATFSNKTDLVRSVLQMLQTKTLYPMFTDKIITPTFIDEIAAGVAKVISQPPQGIIHFVGSSCLSHYDLAQKIASLFDFDPNLVQPSLLSDYEKQNPQSRPYPHKLQISNHKALNQLGIVFSSIDTALQKLKEQTL